MGGLEAPDPYRVRCFVNRWPAMTGDRCEVVLFSPDHDASLGGLSQSHRREVVDLWAERTAVLGARHDVDYVLCFENRGAEVGATIHHPHGQIYAYDHVPTRPSTTFARGWTPLRDRDGGDATIDEATPTGASPRMVSSMAGWEAWVPWAPEHPVAVTLAPIHRVPDLVHLDDPGRDGLAAILGDVLVRLDRLAQGPMPYMMWLTQGPTVTGGEIEPWLHVEIVSPWRGPDRLRYIAAAEIGAGEYFNPVVPEDLARRLRDLGSPDVPDQFRGFGS